MRQPILGAGLVGVAAALVVACGTHPSGTRHPVTTTGQGSGSAGAGSAATGQGSAAKPGTAPDIGVLATTCVFYVGTGTYYTCLAGGEGTCFHIGAACTPPDACMWDVASRSYKSCAKSDEGRCSQWGAACAPASKCWFDPKDGLHRTCDQVTGGSCARYGALCAP